MLWGVCRTQASPLPRVAVRIVSSTGVDDHIVAAMFRELASIWKRGGVEVLFFAEGLDPRPVTTVSLILSPGWPPPEASGGLGWIHFVADHDSRPVPVFVLSLPATRALVEAADYRGVPVVQRPVVVREELLARALGRAAAHELGHYLLASREHAPRGLMRARFRADELVGRDAGAFCLEVSESQMVAARLREAQFLLAGGEE